MVFVRSYGGNTLNRARSAVNARGCAIHELGRSLGPLLATLAEWSTDNLEKVERARTDFDG